MPNTDDMNDENSLIHPACDSTDQQPADPANLKDPQQQVYLLPHQRPDGERTDIQRANLRRTNVGRLNLRRGDVWMIDT